MKRYLKSILQQGTALSVHIINKQCTFCFFHFDNKQKIHFEFSIGDERKNIGEQINEKIKTLKPNKVIVGYNHGILSFDFQCPPLKQSLLKQSIHFQLEDLYPFNKDNLNYAHHVLAEHQGGIDVRGFVVEQSYYDELLANLNNLDYAIDLLTTVEIAGKRLYQDTDFYQKDKENDFVFQIPSLKSFPQEWQEDLPSDIKNHQVGAVILAIYAASNLFEKDKKNWFPLPKHLVKKVSLYKALLLASCSLFILIFTISLFGMMKNNFKFWKENRIFLNNKIKQNKQMEKLLNSKQVNKKFAEEIMRILKHNNRLNKANIIISLTELLLDDYFVTRLDINSSNVSCRIQAKSDSEMKPQIYQAFLQEKQFSNLQISDEGKGKYFLRFSY